MMEGNKINKNSSCSREDLLKYYCRVCTSNSKAKRPKSEDPNIGIFKKIGLKSILEKFLHLEISEDDSLPKTICKKCFDKLMAVEFLQVVAKRSESLFKDFLSNRSQEDGAVQNSGFIIKSPPQTKIENKPNEVVVNVSMSDPLTKDINKKLQVAQSERDSIGIAFSPDHLNRNAVTSSPLVQVPVTIVHRMPKKRKLTVSGIEANQIVQTPLPYTSTTTVTLENPPKKKLPMLKPKINQTTPLRHISEAPSIPQNVEIHPVVTGKPHAMGHGMPLGSIIKDVDLLKLILKALKWPYNSQTLDIQIQRLKNTNFNDVIVDPNLLQDTDLIQILGPLLAPLPVIMQQQTYHITIPPETVETPPTTMSYKLPAETSVQIITVPAAESEPTEIRKERSSKRHIKSSEMRKKYGNSHKQPRRYSPTVIVVSDDSHDGQSSQKLPGYEEIPNFEVQLDPAIYPGVGENSNSNEEMLATLNRQREAMMRMHRSKRKQSLSCAKNVEMVDDIMIVDEGYHMNEPYPEVMLVKKKDESHGSQSTPSISQPKTKSRMSLPTTDSEKKDPSPSAPARIKSHRASISKPSTSMKIFQRSAENLASEKAQSGQGFIKLKENSALPPLKKVKVLPKAGLLQVKEPSQLVYMSKNTTVADADSTTKIVKNDSKVPKTWNFDSKTAKSKKTVTKIWNPNKIFKAKKTAQVNKSEPIVDHSSPSTKAAENEEKKELDDVLVEDTTLAPEKKKSKSAKKSIANQSTTKKNEVKNATTFSISDVEMDPLRVEEVSEEQNATLETASKPVAEKEPENETKLESQSTKTDGDTEKFRTTSNPDKPAIEIKAENDEEIEIKKEESESIANQVETPNKSQRSLGGGKIAIKTDILKCTRSSTKKKVTSKEEEAPLETTSFRPARKSKTLSKYYKGPPLTGTAGRSMRSRT